MSDAGTTNDGAKTATGNDWVAEELAKAKKEFNEASARSKGRQSDETLKAGAKVKALRDGLIYKSKKEIEDQKTKMQASLDTKKAAENKARTASKAAIKMEKMAAVSVTFIGSYGSSDDKFIKKAKELYGMSLTKEDIKKFNKGWQDWMTKKYGRVRVDADGVYIKEYQKYLQEESKKKGKALIDAKSATREYKGYVYQCEYALEYLNKHGTPTKGNSKTKTLGDETNTGSGVGSGGNDGSSGAGSSGGNDGAGSSGGAGGAGGTTGQATEEVLQTDENGNKLIRITDANGNKSFVVKDKDGNRKSIKDEEIKKTSVKPEDIQEAIQKGDWKTLLALFLKAIGERDKQAAAQNLFDEGQSKAQAQQTGPKEYRTEDGDVFTVTKDGDNIISISMQEKGKTPFSLTAAELEKYGVKPTDVEKMLDNKQFNQAGGTLLDVGYKTGKIIHSPEIEVKGNDIILKDHHTFTGERKEPLVLNEQYLIDKCGMKKGKAEKAMENLRELAKSGNMKQSATMIVAQYFSTEKPAPKLPDVQATYGSPKLNKNPGGKVISITVKDASGKEKELGYKDFAQAYRCTPEEAKKLRKECVRAIQNGKDVNGVLSFVAENSEGKSKFWTKSATKIGAYVVGAAAVGVGAYAAFGGFKKKDDDNEEKPQSLTVALETVKTDESNKSSVTASETTNDTTTPTKTTTITHSNPITPFIKGGNTR